ncbi:hypothetical protein TOTORO_01200 [Serratia phage vB_SmaS-Totoro]|nr:hypothetical protein TOTORO_01200 [Serratia phage vB_SmaS-Totoro]
MKLILSTLIVVLSFFSLNANAALIGVSDAPEYDFVVGDTAARVTNLRTNKVSRCELLYNDNGIDKDNLIYVVSFFQCDAGFVLMAKITTENGNLIIGMSRNGASKQFYHKYAKRDAWKVIE